MQNINGDKILIKFIHFNNSKAFIVGKFMWDNTNAYVCIIFKGKMHTYVYRKYVLYRLI